MTLYIGFMTGVRSEPLTTKVTRIRQINFQKWQNMELLQIVVEHRDDAHSLFWVLSISYGLGAAGMGLMRLFLCKVYGSK